LSASSWPGLKLGNEVTLLLGYRPKPGTKDLEAGRVELNADLASDLLSNCRRWLNETEAKTPVPYEAELHLEPEEYLSVGIGELPRVQELTQHGPPAPPSAKDVQANGVNDSLNQDSEKQPEEDESADSNLKTIVDNAFTNDDWIRADDLRKSYLFYAIAVKDTSGIPVAFIKQTSPQRVAKTGGLLTMFDNVLRQISSPVMVFDADVDLILHKDRLAIFRALAFERLLSDLEISKALVPEHVRAISSNLELADGLPERLVTVGQSRSRTQRLLREISSLSKAQWAARTAERVREKLEERKLNASDFLDHEGKLRVDDSNVPVLLEVLASRYYTSDFDNEEMRADKARHRISPSRQN
jgi:hypothetical protein